ncbi:MAG: transposase [Candidatus Cloacimonadaceae bacterium]|nr:transposase [Candidatus Cloacimonadaceae bacterium]
MTRFLGRFNSQGLNEHLRENICTKFLPKLLDAANITSDSLRFDSTVVTRYGEQDGAKRGYNPSKKGRLSHQPQIAFLGSGYTVNFWNRSGNISSGNGIVDFFNQTILSIPEIKVERVLADSGYYKQKIIKALEAGGYEYVISAPISQIIQRKIHAMKDWTTIAHGLEIAEFEFAHSAEHWGQARRYVVVRQEVEVRPKAPGKQLTLFAETYDGSRYRHSLMVTNNETDSPHDIWSSYKPRANDENVTLEHERWFWLINI